MPEDYAQLRDGIWLASTQGHLLDLKGRFSDRFQLAWYAEFPNPNSLIRHLEDDKRKAEQLKERYPISAVTGYADKIIRTCDELQATVKSYVDSKLPARPAREAAGQI